MKAKHKPTPQDINWPRADPEALRNFDPAVKTCTMNCGPHALDPRDVKERKYLCGDCHINLERPA
jgi:predicted SprT family Zn-dependent metalloprotease